MAIDRYKLVSRHNPTLRSVDTVSPFTVGNGEFAFTADITGLQTFHNVYELFPLCAMSQWGWHSFPVDMDESKLRLKSFKTYDRDVGYAIESGGQQMLYDNLRQNAHRLNLGVIGLKIELEGRRARLEDILQIDQTLDLWRGLLISRFSVFGSEVLVETCVDPMQDVVSARVVSGLVESGIISVEIDFHYGSSLKNASDWNNEDRHKSEIISMENGRTVIKRVLDNDIYFVNLVSEPKTRLVRSGRHTFLLVAGSKEINFSCHFTKELENSTSNDFYETMLRSALHWEKFWNSGGVVQLVNSSDPRAYELERRIVLSQYLTAIQCSGTIPPAETGLTCNSWYGKFHLEMHYWHAAHFPIWGRLEMLERSLDWYEEILPLAREIAVKQGYFGARWPKMCDASGRNSPSHIAVLLIWQQPHPIMLAELCYRAKPCKEMLDKYLDLVVESAEFMASYAHYDSRNERYVLGPPLIPAQETHEPSTCLNPTYELEYFRWGLETAISWLQRLGRDIPEHFAEVARKLSQLPQKDGVYLAHENCPETFSRAPFFHDHPSMLAALGVLPGSGVQRGTMKKTIDKVLTCWDFDSMWGWDFPMMAMCCARLGLQSLALDLLLMDKPKNTYKVNGHNPQADRSDLPLYLPGNGGLLLAVGMMAAGWDSDSRIHAPGFPKDGKWVVEVEGLTKYI